MRARINEKGTADKYKVASSDNEILNQAAIDAVLAGEYAPATQNGKPIAMWVTIPVRFTLSD